MKTRRKNIVMFLFLIIGFQSLGYSQDDYELSFPAIFVVNENQPIHNRNEFLPVAKGIEEYHLEIFNRWGKMIFQSNDINVGWDGYINGKIAKKRESFYYVVNVKCSNGEKIYKNGTFTITYAENNTFTHEDERNGKMEDQDFAVLYFYNHTYVSRLTVFINNVNIGTINENIRKLIYKVYSQGKISVECIIVDNKGREILSYDYYFPINKYEKTDLEIFHGDTIYLRFTYNKIAGKNEKAKDDTLALKFNIVHNAIGKREFYSIKKKTEPIYASEDRNNPIIKNELTTDEYEGTVAIENDEAITENNSNILSEVDQNIPLTGISKPNTYALIIGNEDYSSYQTGLSGEVNVDYAINDARIFREYLIRTIGIPEKNILYLENGTSAQMKREIAMLSQLAQFHHGEAELVFYYSGHGLPDETSQEAYLIPVDVSGADINSGINLNDLYTQLSKFPSKRITVFLDACFSGGARNQPLIAMRGVRVPPKENLLHGNMVVFSSSSGKESSGAYHEMQHGMFTYFLLKKLQETGGDIIYQELSDYLYEYVGRESLLINDKLQFPQTLISPEIELEWENWTLK